MAFWRRRPVSPCTASAAARPRAGVRQTNENLARLSDLCARAARQAPRPSQATGRAGGAVHLPQRGGAPSPIGAAGPSLAGSRARGGGGQRGDRRTGGEARGGPFTAAGGRGGSRAGRGPAHGHATGEYNERYRATLEVRTQVGRAEEAVWPSSGASAEICVRPSPAVRRRWPSPSGRRRSTGPDWRELEGRLGGERGRLERAREDASEAGRRLLAAEQALAAFRAEHEASGRSARRQGREADAGRSNPRPPAVPGCAKAPRRGRQDSTPSASPPPRRPTTKRSAGVVEALESRQEDARRRLQESQRVIAEFRKTQAADADVLHERRERLEAMSGRLASLDALQQAALGPGVRRSRGMARSERAWRGSRVSPS